MTGFGKGEAESNNWKSTAMIRSLNGKGLDISVRMASYLIPVEPKIKEIIKSRLRRGSVQVIVDVESKVTQPPVDMEKLMGGISMLKEISEESNLKLSDDTIFEFSWKYAEKTTIDIDEELETVILESVHGALEELIKSRKKEGETIRKDILGRLDKIKDLLDRIMERKEQIHQSIKNKVLERAKKIGLEEEHPIVLNELLFLLGKMDVEEETTRLKAHLKAFEQLINSNGEMGKKLEFLAQEMHREITTLGNKIPDLSEFVVDIKTEVDRIKQQAANVE